MRYCRFNQGRLGLVQDDRVYELAHVPPGDDSVIALLMGVTAPETRGAATYPLEQTILESPIARPGKVVAAPVNYKAHIEEMLRNGQAHGHVLTDVRQAGLFLKASSSVVGPGQGIAVRFPERRTDHEIELCAVIGTRASCVSAADALAHVAGYCLGLDITVRGPEDRSFRKSIDSYTVLGPYVVAAAALGDPQRVELELSVNGEVRQHANTEDMVHSVASLIEFASSFYTLEPGDVLMTGTPQGVGPIRAGDLLVARGSGLGTMEVKVRAA